MNTLDHRPFAAGLVMLGFLIAISGAGGEDVLAAGLGMLLALLGAGWFKWGSM